MSFKLIGMCLVIVSLSSCGKASSQDASSTECKDSAVIGSWITKDGSDLLIANANCTVTSSACGSTMSIPASMQGRSGSGEIEVLSTKGSSACLSKGTHTCSYVIEYSSTYEIDVMALSCGGTAVLYGKMN